MAQTTTSAATPPIEQLELVHREVERQLGEDLAVRANVITRATVLVAASGLLHPSVPHEIADTRQRRRLVGAKVRNSGEPVIVAVRRKAEMNVDPPAGGLADVSAREAPPAHELGGDRAALRIAPLPFLCIPR